MYKGVKVLLYVTVVAELLPWLTGRPLDAYVSWSLWIVGGVCLAIASLERVISIPAADSSDSAPMPDTPATDSRPPLDSDAAQSFSGSAVSQLPAADRLSPQKDPSISFRIKRLHQK